MNLDRLNKYSAEIRLTILKAIAKAKKGHIGGAYSCTDILVALYHGGILRFDTKNPRWEHRDRFILSKGHSAIALYAVLANLGFFKESELMRFGGQDSILGGHPDPQIPGIEIVSGSLGHGLGIGAGLALGAKMNNRNFMTIVLMGDGECYEGSVWEAILFASHHSLNNLTVIIDRNRQCVMDFTEDCLKLEPLKDKFLAFGWDVLTVDGHSFESMMDIFSSIRNRPNNKPLSIIAETIKGKGVSFMESNLKWHHCIPSIEEFEIAQRELSI